MTTFQHLSITELAPLIETGSVQLVDIRDIASFQAGRIPGTRHLDSTTLPAFLEQSNAATPVVVCCYHGNSSQSAAAFLADQGFATVYSLDGGFTAWQEAFPTRVEHG